MQITVNCPPNCNSYIIHDKWLTKQQSEYRIQALQSVRDVPRQWQWCISPLKLFLICDIVVFPCVSLKNIKSFSRHGLWFIYIVYILIPYCHAVTLPSSLMRIKSVTTSVDNRKGRRPMLFTYTQWEVNECLRPRNATNISFEGKCKVQTKPGKLQLLNT